MAEDVDECDDVLEIKSRQTPSELSHDDLGAILAATGSGDSSARRLE